MEEPMTRAKPERACLVYAAVAICTTTVALPARAQSLPQGLTCGLSYQNNEFQINNACSGQFTYASPGGYLNLPAPQYAAVWDRDNGYCFSCNTPPYGFAHQELLACPQGNPNCLSGGLSVAVGNDDSTHFVLPQGAVCGFHHTAYTPGHTCMGFNPTKAFPDIQND